MQVVAVTSGKGGVGKTHVAVNLAVSLARRGRQVVLFDADLGLANVDIALGLRTRYDIRHVLSGECALEDVLVEGPGGVRVVPAASGVSGLTRLESWQQRELINAFSDLSVPVDTLIVDTAAGLESSVLTFASACQQVLVVLCDEPTSIADAYALIKVMHREYGTRHFQVVANMVSSDTQGRTLYGKLAQVSDRFLNVNLDYLGAIPRDNYVRRAAQQQRAVVQQYPRSLSARALFKLAATLDKQRGMESQCGGLGFFLERLVSPPCPAVEV
jgi:flagellar biosynthesis protein FlhG